MRCAQGVSYTAGVQLGHWTALFGVLQSSECRSAQCMDRTFYARQQSGELWRNKHHLQVYTGGGCCAYTVLLSKASNSVDCTAAVGLDQTRQDLVQLY